MKTLSGVLLAAALFTLGAFAADQPNTNQPPPATAAGPGQGTNIAKRKPLSAEERAEYNRIARTELELNTRLKLLGEMAGEHSRRADESRVGFPEKARWESELAQELRDKSTALLAQLNVLTKERLAFEAARGPTQRPPLPLFEDTRSLNPEEFAYLTQIQERLLRTRQELVATDLAAKALYSELQTNNSPEAMERISLQLDENNRQTRQWEREQTDLELKESEFRVLRSYFVPAKK